MPDSDEHYGWNFGEAVRRTRRAEIEDAYREGRVSEVPSLAALPINEDPDHVH